MKILITGASGFIGGRLVRAAVSRFGVDNVLALSSLPIEGIDTLIYNVTDYGISQTNRLQDIDILIHAGSFTPKSGTEANDIHGCNSNIRFVEKLISHSFPSLSSIIYLSTLDVYAPCDLTDEDTPTIPETMYGLSKLYCETMLRQITQVQGINYHILRIGHVYGPGEEKYKKFIPNVMRNILVGKPVELWGDGSDLRSYIFIDDVINAILVAVTLTDAPEIINIVSGSAYSIKDLLAKIIGISGEKVKIIPRPFTGAKRDHVFDNGKCKTFLLPKESDLTDGLRAELKHFKSLL